MLDILEAILAGAVIIGLPIFFGVVVWKVTGDEFDPLHDKLWVRILLTALATLALPILMLVLY